MSRVTRRAFVQRCLTSVGVSGWYGCALQAAASESAGGEGLTLLGRVAPRDASTIKASPLSVGFETLLVIIQRILITSRGKNVRWRIA